MPNYIYFIGIDVQKTTLYLTLRTASEILDHQIIENQSTRILSCVNTWSEKYADFSIRTTLICLKNTRYYINVLLHTLILKDYSIWVENVNTVRYSMGLKRGKKNKVDAHQLAEYAWQYQEDALLYIPTSESIEKLQALQAIRIQLIIVKNHIKAELNKSKIHDKKPIYQLKEKSYLHTLKTVHKDLKEAEKQMNRIIDYDDQLKQLMNILTSITGIGTTAAKTLINLTRGVLLSLQSIKNMCFFTYLKIRNYIKK